MMKSGAPPDKFKSCTVWLLTEFHGFTSRIHLKSFHSLVPGLISIFIETVWVPLTLAISPACWILFLQIKQKFTPICLSNDSTVIAHAQSVFPGNASAHIISMEECRRGGGSKVNQYCMPQ